MTIKSSISKWMDRISLVSALPSQPSKVLFNLDLCAVHLEAAK